MECSVLLTIMDMLFTTCRLIYVVVEVKLNVVLSNVYFTIKDKQSIKYPHFKKSGLWNNYGYGIYQKILLIGYSGRFKIQ